MLPGEQMQSRSGIRRRAARLLGVAALALVAAGCLGPTNRLTVIDAVRLPETSDPSVVRVGDTYYVYGSNNHLRAPVFVTKDLSRPYSLSQKNASTYEAMPAKPPWAASNVQLWAPTVGQFAGRWVMFFAADRINPPQPHNAQCIGRAWANSPTGPFVAEASPFTCGLGGVGGALDPQLYSDPWGRHWLLAAFGNTESPIHVIQLDAAANAAGPPRAILGRRHAWEYHFIEQPAMVWDPAANNYILTYSAGKWWESSYSTGIARCLDVIGPCFSDPAGAWIASSNGRTAPGGLSFFQDADGAQRAIFSTFPAGGETTNGNRSASIYYMKFGPAPALTVVK